MTFTTYCITANLDLLGKRLAQAAITAREAADALRDGNRNLAIGTLLPLEQDLTVARALYRTILTLHQMPAIDDNGRQQGGVA